MEDEEREGRRAALEHIMGKLKSYRGLVPMTAAIPSDNKTIQETNEAPVEMTLEEETEVLEPNEKEECADPDEGTMRIVEHLGPRGQAKRGRGRPKKGY